MRPAMSGLMQSSIVTMSTALTRCELLLLLPVPAPTRVVSACAPYANCAAVHTFVVCDMRGGGRISRLAVIHVDT